MSIKLFSLAKELNIGVNTLVSFLNDKGKEVDNNPNTRITEDEFNLVLRDFTPTFDEETVERTKKKFLRSKSAPKAKAEEPAKTAKTEANSPEEQPTKAKASAAKKAQAEPDIPTTTSASQLNVVGRIELDKHNNPVSASTGKTSAATQEEPAKTKSAAKTSKAKGTATSKQKEAKPEEPTKTKASTTAEQPKAATPAKETKETKKAPETKETKAETKPAESPKPSAKAASKEPESDTSKESTPVAP
ncbi:translation initiation factor IF-2 N-terminal domain-containing protein, partial [uncultured Porphyromonas sp.]|uniref:translation initiation factor IF-2 N-terminal domain-containing protein n=1 Tax=uncultured Porphyromonas sp. TaxID=159274 RepID=UPI0025E0D660